LLTFLLTLPVSSAPRYAIVSASQAERWRSSKTPVRKTLHRRVSRRASLLQHLQLRRKYLGNISACPAAGLSDIPPVCGLSASQSHPITPTWSSAWSQKLQNVQVQDWHRSKVMEFGL